MILGPNQALDTICVHTSGQKQINERASGTAGPGVSWQTGIKSEAGGSFGAHRPDFCRGFYLIKTNEQMPIACVGGETVLPDYTL